jgi:hypothetical protein
MTTQIKLLKRCSDIITLGEKSQIANDKMQPDSNANELFYSLKSSLESFIILLYGQDHPHYKIVSNVHGSRWFIIKSFLGVLSTIKTEIEEGWLNSIKGIVSAEIFADFLEMADHLLKEKYKDPAAVIIGGVLEEHIRQLSMKNDIETEVQKDGKNSPKKADQLNADLCKIDVYNKLDQKSVTSWLDLRNKAAHAKYNEYTQQQVELMLQAVLDFINRNSI